MGMGVSTASQSQLPVRYDLVSAAARDVARHQQVLAMVVGRQLPKQRIEKDGVISLAILLWIDAIYKQVTYSLPALYSVQQINVDAHVDRPEEFGGSCSRSGPNPIR
jgi:hypothetical protein